MRTLVVAASLAAAASLGVASASAGEPPASPAPSASTSASTSTPAPASPAAAAPPVDVPAPPAAPPGYPASSPSGPGHAAPYAVYAAPDPGAPPPSWMGARPVTERRSNSMRITGIVLLSVGGLISATGAAFVASGFHCFGSSTSANAAPPPPPREGPAPAPASAGGQGGGERIGSARQALNTCKTMGAGFGLFAGGLVGAIAGIPLLVIGSKQVPAGPMKGAPLPEVTVGAGSASLRWTF